MTDAHWSDYPIVEVREFDGSRVKSVSQELSGAKFARVIPEGVDVREVEVVKRTGATKAERFKDQASTMQNLAAEVKKATKDHFDRGVLKDHSPPSVRFRVGDSEFTIWTEALPVFEKRLRALTKPGAFKFKGPEKIKGAGTTSIKDIDVDEVIALPKFAKRLAKAETDLVEAVKAVPELSSVRSIKELQSHARVLDPKDFDKVTKQLNDLYKDVGAEFDDVALSRGRRRPYAGVKNEEAGSAADVVGDDENARALRQWLTKKEEFINQRLNALLAGETVSPIEEAFPLKVLRPREGGE